MGVEHVPRRAQEAPAPARTHAPALQRSQATAAASNLAMQVLLRGGMVRAKLAVGGRDDPKEREADATADRVMRSSDASCCSSRGGGGCEDETARRKPDGASASTLSRGAEAQIRSLAGRGDNLSPHLRAFFEPRLGRDLSHVRVHRDSVAADSARGIGARAYTLGADIAFASDQWQPDTASGRHLIAHELAHVGQNGAAVRRDGPPTPVDQNAVSTSLDTIIDALEGYTSADDSNNILNQFRGKSPATVLALVEEVKRRGSTHGKSADEMVDWLLGDLTEEDRRELRGILAAAHSPDIERVVTTEIQDLLAGYTSENDSSQIVTLFSGFPPMGIDAVLTRLETLMGQDRDTMRAQLFGDLDRVNAERLRQLFFAHGGALAAQYAAGWTASKTYNLLSGYTSHSDSTDIVWNFGTTPTPDLQGLVLVRLDVICRAERQQSAEDSLMHDMDAGDYERLRAMGLSLAPYRDTRSTATKIVSALEWADIVAEWVVCGIVGVVTGIAAAIWDIVKGIKDIVIGIWDLIWSLVYLLSRGAAGSDNWLRVKNFFSGIATLFTDPGKVWDSYWEEKSLEFHTIEGAFSDCRRAEYLVRQFVGALVNVLLIFLAGYGLVKGAVSGVRAVAGVAEVADVIGVRGVISAVGTLAKRRILKFVAAEAGAARALLGALREPLPLLQSINTRVRTVLIAAEDAGYWRYLREQAGTAVQAGADIARDRFKGEKKYWDDNRNYWKRRGQEQQAGLESLTADRQTVEQHLEGGEQPDPPTTVTEMNADTHELDVESSELQDDVIGKSGPGGEAPVTPPPTAPPETIEQMITDVLSDAEPQGATPLNPADFGPPARRVVHNINEISLDEIPQNWRGYYEAAYPRYVARRQGEIARGINANRPIVGKDNYMRLRWANNQASGIALDRGAAAPRDLGLRGAIEQQAGHVLEKVVDARLPGSSNTTAFPNPYDPSGRGVAPDHLPAGSNVTVLDSRGYRAAQGQPFSARFVGDSKYKEYIDINEQTRGFVNLARFSDEQTLVFYMRWQDTFPAAEMLAYDAGLGGRVLPVRPWNEQLVSPGLREFARARGVKIRIVSDPLWR